MIRTHLRLAVAPPRKAAALLARWSASILCLVCLVLPFSKGWAQSQTPGERLRMLSQHLSLAPQLQRQRRTATEEFRALTEQLSSAPANFCPGEGPAPAHPEEIAEIENKVFGQADALVLQALKPPSLGKPPQAVTDILRQLEAISDKSNRTWPAKQRFRFEVLDLGSLIVVKMTLRGRGTFSAFGTTHPGSAPGGGSGNTKWEHAGEDAFRYDAHGGFETLSLYVLARGPSGRPRFLAEFELTWCTAGDVLDYTGYDWDPATGAGLGTILHRHGTATSEHWIGKLETSGTTITLPYCWHSPWGGGVWAELCSVDTFDLAGDDVRSVGTRTNKPDLEAIDRAIRYAQAGDFNAVLAYCASAEVAHELVEQMPPELGGSGLIIEVTPVQSAEKNAETEAVEFGSDWSPKFVLEKRNSRWLVKSFSIERNY